MKQTLQTLLQKSTHIGHQTIRASSVRPWHPTMTAHLYGIRKHVVVLHPRCTSKYLLNVFFLIAAIVQRNGHLCLINVNPEYSFLFQNLHSHVTSLQKTHTMNLSFCCTKWIGGTLTNWRIVRHSMSVYGKFSYRFDEFLLSNNIHFPKYKKMKKHFQGFLSLTTSPSFLPFVEKPDMIICINAHESAAIIAEAHACGIPVVALCDSTTKSNCLPYGIPTNTVSIHFVYFFLLCIVKIVQIFSKTSKRHKGCLQI